MYPGGGGTGHSGMNGGSGGYNSYHQQQDPAPGLLFDVRREKSLRVCCLQNEWNSRH
jgi:hypothetical protein